MSGLSGPDEFTAAFARHGRALWVVAAAWVGKADAMDLVQETARIAWERRTEFAPGTDARAWLSQIVRNVGANWRRRRLAEPADPAVLQTTVTASPAVHPVQGFDAESLGLPDDLAAGLAALDEVPRACLLLQVVTGLTFAEIAAMLDIPENTAASHARRARLRLREALARRSTVEAP
ncbi:MAG: RNA polymerase sigma factor [Planctomycetota bacterium]